MTVFRARNSADKPHFGPRRSRHFLRAIPEDRVIRGVRLVYQGSETLYRSDVELFKRHFEDGCLTLNSLGASEMKQFALLRIDTHTEIEDRVVPIVYALPGAEVDERGEPVEPDVIGEIVVRSRYIAPGYWHWPQVTARVFPSDLV